MTALEFVAIAVVVAFLLFLLTAVLSAVRNPIVNVADELVTGVSPAVVESEVATLLASARRLDFRMLAPGTYALSYQHYPGAAIVVGVLFFPVGLLLPFLLRKTLVLTVSVAAEGTGTRIRVAGHVHKRLAEVTGEALQRRFQTQGVRV